MIRTRVRRRRAVVLAAGIAVAIAWAGPVGNALGGPARPVEQRRYVVRPGDTLWSLARRLAPSKDPRAVVGSLVAANGVQASELVPGRTLVIPSID